MINYQQCLKALGTAQADAMFNGIAVVLCVVCMYMSNCLHRYLKTCLMHSIMSNSYGILSLFLSELKGGFAC